MQPISAAAPTLILTKVGQRIPAATLEPLAATLRCPAAAFSTAALATGARLRPLSATLLRAWQFPVRRGSQPTRGHTEPRRPRMEGSFVLTQVATNMPQASTAQGCALNRAAAHLAVAPREEDAVLRFSIQVCTSSRETSMCNPTPAFV